MKQRSNNHREFRILYTGCLRTTTMLYFHRYSSLGVLRSIATTIMEKSDRICISNHDCSPAYRLHYRNCDTEFS
jgi:hypothetical protein